MGRVKSITPLVCNGSHFTYEERIQLEFYLSGTGKLPKITNKVMLGTLLHKSPRTIAREIQRGQVEHFFDEGLQKRWFTVQIVQKTRQEPKTVAKDHN